MDFNIVLPYLGNPRDARAIATSYAQLGLATYPIQPYSKVPAIKGWNQGPVMFRAEIHSKFDAWSNIGVRLGAVSGGLVDIDVDRIEAVQLAPQFLPPTGAIFGRPGKPQSHWLYGLTSAIKSMAFCLDEIADGKKPTIVEIRSDGHGSTFPGSVYENGEPIVWYVAGEPALVPPDILWSCVLRLANAVRALHGQRPLNNEGHSPKERNLASRYGLYQGDAQRELPHVRDFLRRLRVEGPGSSRNTWTGHCPAHSDCRASLSVSVGTNGGLLIYCHAGCELKDILRAMGLAPRNLHEVAIELPHARRRRPPRG